MNTRLTLNLVAALFGVAFNAEIHAQPSAFTYQGELAADGSPATGLYDFEFTLYDSSGGGVVIAGPVIPAPVAVSNGVFTVALDFGAGVFDGSDRWLGIGVVTNGGGAFTPLSPRQQITSAPYAVTAGGVPSGAITSGMIAAGAVNTAALANDAVTLNKMADDSVGSREIIDGEVETAELMAKAVTNPKIADGAVDSRTLASSLTVSSGSTSGDLTIWNGSVGNAAVKLLGQSRQIQAVAPDNSPRARMDAAGAGRLLLDSTGNQTTIELNADDGIATSKEIRVLSGVGGKTNVVLNSASNGGQVYVRDELGNTKGVLATGLDGGFLQLNQEGGLQALLADGGAGSEPGGALILNQADGDVGAVLDGDVDSEGVGGALTLFQDDGDIGVLAFADSEGSGLLQLHGSNGVPRVVLDADDDSGDGKSGGLTVYGSNESELFRVSESDQGALLEMWNTYLPSPTCELRSGWINEGGKLTLRTTTLGLRGANLEAQDSVGPVSGGLLELRHVNEGGSVVVVKFTGRSGGTNFVNNTTYMNSLGLDRVPAANDLEVEGDASKTSAGDWLANSDARIKTQIKPICNALETVGRIRPVKFHYRPEYLAQHPKLRDIEYHNVIAQEFAEVFPNSVSEGGDTLANGDRVLQVDTYPATITGLAAIQELHALVKDQQKRIAELESRLAEFAISSPSPGLTKNGGAK